MREVDVIEGRMLPLPDVTSEGRRFTRRLLSGAMSGVTFLVACDLSYKFGQWFGGMVVTA